MLKGLWANICLGWWATLWRKRCRHILLHILPFVLCETSFNFYFLPEFFCHNLSKKNKCLETWKTVITILILQWIRSTFWVLITEFLGNSMPPLRSPPPLLFYPLLFSSFHCNLLFLCPQNCSSRYPQYLGQWMITYMLLNGEPLKSDVELFTIFWSVMK